MYIIPGGEALETEPRSKPSEREHLHSLLYGLAPGRGLCVYCTYCVLHQTKNTSGFGEQRIKTGKSPDSLESMHPSVVLTSLLRADVQLFYL